MRCRECGAQLSDDAKFCRECGAKVTASENEIQFCRECGRKLEPDSKFCPGCGKPVEHIPLPEFENKVSDQIQETAQVQEESQEDKPFWERPVKPRAEDINEEKKREETPLPPPFPDYHIDADDSETQTGRQSTPEITAEPNKVLEFLKKVSKQGYQKFMDFWMSLSKYGKVMTSALFVLSVLMLSAFFAGHIFAGVMAFIQITLVTVSWFMHIGKVKEPKPNMQKYLLIAALVLLLPYLLSINTGKTETTEALSSTVQKETDSPAPVETAKQEKKETMPQETQAPIIETTIPVLIDNQPEMYYGIWAFNALEKEGKTVTNEELIQNGDDYLNSYRIVFRSDGSGCIYEQSGTTDFNWKITPSGIKAGIITGFVVNERLCLVHPEQKMYLIQETTKQGIPDLYREAPAVEPTAEKVAETEAETKTTESVTEAVTEAPVTVETEAAVTTPTAAPSQAPEEDSPKTDAVYYSSNSYEKAKKGNSGLFAYKSKGGPYTKYYIIDFNAGYVYFFTDGNDDSSCERVKIESGHLNDVMIITYHDGGSEWSYGLHFKYKDHPEHLIMQDNDGFEYDFYPTDLIDAQSIKGRKTIHDY